MLSVLIVEDEEMIRRGIVTTVDWQSLDCVVAAEAANGEDGLIAARRCHPDLIITDIKLPRMDGIEMLRRLREEGCEALVIFLTAYSTFEYAQSALRLGAVDFLPKPFHDGDLEQAITALKGRLQPQQPDTSTVFHGFQTENLSRYVQQAVLYVHEHYSEPAAGVGSIAEYLGISESHLSHIFKKETDYTLMSYLTRYRIYKAQELLHDCRIRVYEVTECVGYRDITYFSTIFKKIVGMSPSEYQNTCHPDKTDIGV